MLILFSSYLVFQQCAIFIWITHLLKESNIPNPFSSEEKFYSQELNWQLFSVSLFPLIALI